MLLLVREENAIDEAKGRSCERARRGTKLSVGISAVTTATDDINLGYQNISHG